MSEYQTFRCDHCTGPKKKGLGKRLKPIYKKIKSDKLYLLVKEYILEITKKREKRKEKEKEINQKRIKEGKSPYMSVFIFNDSAVYAENIAKHFQVKTHEVKKVFKKLNQEGILSQGKNSPPHDSRRERGWGHDNSWRATIYYINR